MKNDGGDDGVHQNGNQFFRMKNEGKKCRWIRHFHHLEKNENGNRRSCDDGDDGDDENFLFLLLPAYVCNT